MTTNAGHLHVFLLVTDIIIQYDTIEEFNVD